jgi:hypothetical protein
MNQHNQRLTQKFAATTLKRKALKWWNRLNSHQQNDIENQTFGPGEYWEDNRLTEDDIITMYKKTKI